MAINNSGPQGKDQSLQDIVAHISPPTLGRLREDCCESHTNLGCLKTNNETQTNSPRNLHTGLLGLWFSCLYTTFNMAWDKLLTSLPQNIENLLIV